MTAVPHQPPLHRRPEELGRRATGAVVEVGLKAYGAAAAVSVALSDAETVGGKGRDALNAVPALVDRYQQAKYVVDHREQIQATLDDVSHRAPDPAGLQQAAGETSRTLGEITTTYDEVNAALETLTSIRPHNVLETVPRVKDHVDRAWAARPDLDSITDLADAAQAVTPFLQRLKALDPQLQRIYADLLSILDNFATDELGATLGVMATAVVLAYALGTGAGFWGRRGRPGLVAATLQGWGARLFGGWYGANLEPALGTHLYAVARRRIQDDIVADPDRALDPEALLQLEQHFERRRAQRSGVSS